MAKRTQRTKLMPIPPNNRKVITDVVCNVMHTAHRDESIDSLLCRPLEAIAMALAVAVRCGQIPEARARRLVRELGRLVEAKEADFVNLICRVALSSRKRGDLRSDRY